MDILRLYGDYSVNHKTEGSKHCRPGWVNTPCPYCVSDPGHEGHHLGWNISEEYYFCWRCGWKSPLNTVSLLLNLPVNQVIPILQQYNINRTIVKSKQVVKKGLKLPSNLTPLQPNHKRYLRKRGFNPQELVERWKIQGTGPLSTLNGQWYRHRIFIPYYWNGQLVTFDTRDITEKDSTKYKACPKEHEVLEHKKILYGNQEAWAGGVGICVEGPTDVWKFGDYSFAVSGINFTPAQVRLIAQIFKKVFIVFDSEKVAQAQARKLRAELRMRGVEAIIVPLPNGGDPGSMPIKEAQEFVNSLMMKRENYNGIKLYKNGKIPN